MVRQGYTLLQHVMTTQKLYGACWTMELTLDAYDFTGRTPLIYAVQAGHPKSVKYLLQSRAHIDAADMNELTAGGHAAIASSHGILKILWIGEQTIDRY